MLGYDPWRHPSIGTNLREPVPADPRAAPQFVPVSQATRAERAAESAMLVKEAGTSARQIGVPLTLQDFPDNPAMTKGRKPEGPLNSSIPAFGLNAPRWRTMQGLEGHTTPDGAAVPPVAEAGLLCVNRERELIPMFLMAEPDGGPDAGAAAPPSLTYEQSGHKLTPHSSVPEVERRQTTKIRGLCRTYAMSNVLEGSTSTSDNLPKPTSLTRSSTMVNIESSSISTSIVPAPAPASSASASTSTAPKPPKRAAKPKRKRQAADLDEPSGAGTSALRPSAEIKQEDEDEAQADPEPARKRRKSAAAPKASSTTTTTTTATTARLGGGARETAAGQGEQPRRSARVTRGSGTGGVAAGSQPAPRGRATKGKKGSKRS